MSHMPKKKHKLKKRREEKPGNMPDTQGETESSKENETIE